MHQLIFSSRSKYGVPRIHCIIPHMYVSFLRRVVGLVEETSTPLTQVCKLARCIATTPSCPIPIIAIYDKPRAQKVKLREAVLGREGGVIASPVTVKGLPPPPKPVVSSSPGEAQYTGPVLFGTFSFSDIQVSRSVYEQLQHTQASWNLSNRCRILTPPHGFGAVSNEHIDTCVAMPAVYQPWSTCSITLIMFHFTAHESREHNNGHPIRLFHAILYSLVWKISRFEHIL